MRVPPYEVAPYRFASADSQRPFFSFVLFKPFSFFIFILLALPLTHTHFLPVVRLAKRVALVVHSIFN